MRAQRAAAGGEHIRACILQAYQDILGVGDLTVAQAKQLFIPMREGGFGLASAELQAEPAMMASWASCAARVTARIGLGGIDDLTAEIPG